MFSLIKNAAKRAAQMLRVVGRQNRDTASIDFGKAPINDNEESEGSTDNLMNPEAPWTKLGDDDERGSQAARHSRKSERIT